MQQPIQDDHVSFAKLIEAVRPWHQHLVIVGGWAHRLHRLIPEARVPSHAPIRTLDADLAFDVRTKLHGDIGSALRASGFCDELATEHEPPVTWYRLGQADASMRSSSHRWLAPALDATEQQMPRRRVLA